MVDIESRILAAANAGAQRDASMKRAAFERLPESHRAFLRQVADTFGKPAAVDIRFADGTGYSTRRGRA